MFHPISKGQEGVKSCMKNCEAADFFLFFKNKEFITLWFKSTYYVVLNAMREKNIVYVHTPQLLNNGRIYWLYILTKRKRAFTANWLNNYKDVEPVVVADPGLR